MSLENRFLEIIIFLLLIVVSLSFYTAFKVSKYQEKYNVNDDPFKSLTVDPNGTVDCKTGYYGPLCEMSILGNTDCPSNYFTDPQCKKPGCINAKCM